MRVLANVRANILAAGGAVLLAALMGGCAGPIPSTFAVAGAGHSPIGPSETEIVTEAARKMTGEADVRVYGLTSKISAGDEGLDICGHVDTDRDAGMALYVELREDNGKVTANRGQIGATPANLAKVRFMCRGHSGW